MLSYRRLRHRLVRTYRPPALWRRLVCYGLGVLVPMGQITPAFAQIVANRNAPGNQQATILQTANGFTSIPKSMYWAIVTITTVGYGDIAPKTPLGQLVASLAMISGYAIIAVPTGIVSSELIRGERPRTPTRPVTCPHCLLEGHQDDARFCRACGAALLSAAPALSVADKTQRSDPG
jgi:hypothetical protein